MAESASAASNITFVPYGCHCECSQFEGSDPIDKVPRDENQRYEITFRELKIILFYIHFLAEMTFQCSWTVVVLFYLHNNSQIPMQLPLLAIVRFILFYVVVF